jgi:hypothetical protein
MLVYMPVGQFDFQSYYLRTPVPQILYLTLLFRIIIILHLYYIVANLLKARTVKPAETAIARKRLYKHPPLLGNGCNWYARNNRKTVRKGVFGAFRAYTII